MKALTCDSFFCVLNLTYASVFQHAMGSKSSTILIVYNVNANVFK